MPKLSELNIREIKEGKVDENGRLYLGPKYADQELRVAVLENTSSGEQDG